ncbi:MAG: hypothetical protein KDD44_05150, partial [Bdellovibrionales bacterium]|nr:hypothetical protein [Bdellovibrionales bacterium]
MAGSQSPSLPLFLTEEGYHEVTGMDFVHPSLLTAPDSLLASPEDVYFDSKTARWRQTITGMYCLPIALINTNCTDHRLSSEQCRALGTAMFECLKPETPGYGDQSRVRRWAEKNENCKVTLMQRLFGVAVSLRGAPVGPDSGVPIGNLFSFIGTYLNHGRSLLVTLRIRCTQLQTGVMRPSPGTILGHVVQVTGYWAGFGVTLEVYDPNSGKTTMRFNDRGEHTSREADP